MFGSEILEVVIGLIFIYLLLALLATTVNELIAKGLSLRGKNLKKTIEHILGSATATSSGSFDIERFYKDPEIKKLSAWPFMNKVFFSPPDYLSRQTFSKILIKAIFQSEAKSNSTTVQALESQIDQMFGAGEDVNKVLKRFVRESSGDVGQIRALVEEWYDDIVDMATEWYKSKMRIILFFLGFAIALAFNADTFSVVKQLRNDPVARKAVLAQAEQYVKAAKEAQVTTEEDLAGLHKDLEKLIKREVADTTVFGMGWRFSENDSTFGRKIGVVLSATGEHFIGWVLTALAISFGAPFWFGMLQKFLRLRHAAQEKREGKTTTQKAVG